MEEKLTLRGTRADKLKAYSGMAAAFLAVAPEADAQVLYTDVDPDVVLANGTYDIDFDADGVNDVNFQHLELNYTSSGSAINIRLGLVAGDILGVATSSGYVYANALAAGALIDPGNAGWNATTGALLGARFSSTSSTSFYGSWPGQTAYLGCRFLSGLGTTHYAWVRLSMDPLVASMTIMGYAFEATPNTAIAAGDEGVISSLSDHLGSGRLQVFPNPVKDRTTLRIGDELNGQVSVQVLDGIGRVVQEDGFNTSTGTRTLDLDLSALPTGTYFVSVRNGDRVIHRKVAKVN